MIVTIAGWLYIINAGLVLLSLRAPLPGIAFSGQLGTALLGAGMGAIGVGLIQRKTWGRWFALGPSFLGWTIGTLLALGMIALLVWFLGNSKGLGGFAGFIGFLIVFTTALSIVGVIINFKLYWHLVSNEGKQEFGAPESDSFMTVLQSAGVWIVATVLSVMLTASGSALGGAAVAAMFGPSRDAEIAESRARALADEQRRAQLENARRADAEAARIAGDESARYSTAPIIADGATAGVSENAPETNYTTAPIVASDQPATIAESPVPDFSSLKQPEDEEKPDTKKILKCRDSSGGIQFTQGYCPPGTKEVAATKFE